MDRSRSAVRQARLTIGSFSIRQIISRAFRWNVFLLPTNTLTRVPCLVKSVVLVRILKIMASRTRLPKSRPRCPALFVLQSHVRSGRYFT